MRGDKLKSKEQLIEELDEMRSQLAEATGQLRDLNCRGNGNGRKSFSENHYWLLFESNPLPMWIFDLDTLEFIEVNQAAVHKYGYSHDEFLAMSVNDVCAHEENGGPRKALSNGTDGSECDGIWRHIRKDGSIIHAEITSHPLLLDGGRCMLVLANDVTERLRAEEAVRRREERYRSLFTNSSDGIYIHDLEGNIIDVNPRSLALFGYSHDEMLGMKVPYLHPPGALDGSMAAFERLLSERQVNYTIDYLKKNGGVFRGDVSSSLFVTDGKRLVQCMIRDKM